MQAPMQSVDWRLHGSGCMNGFMGTASGSLSMSRMYDFGERASEASLASPQGAAFLREDGKGTSDLTKCETHDYDMAKTDFYGDDGGHDMFDMSSFFREHETLKLDADVFDPLTTELEKEQIHPASAETHPDCVLTDDPQNLSSDTVAADNVMDATDSSVDSVVMGIPYYVACQWQQMQQQQQQQHQAVMMLWWQAYLSGAYNMLGPKGMTPTTQLGWSLPTGGLAAFHGAYANFGDDTFYKHLLSMDDKGQAGGSGTKRRRKNDGYQSQDHPNNCKKGRRPRHDERVCKNCGTTETPFWRKDKQDGHPLCNACGLYLSKNDAPRPKVLWKTSERGMGGNPAPVQATVPPNALIV